MKRQRYGSLDFFFKTTIGNFLVVQWLSIHVSTGRGVSSIPGQGVKILYAAQPKKANHILCIRDIPYISGYEQADSSKHGGIYHMNTPQKILM